MGIIEHSLIPEIFPFTAETKASIGIMKYGFNMRQVLLIQSILA